MPADFAYIEELLQDLAKHEQLDGHAVFKQLCDLSVGPLYTAAVVENLSEFLEANPNSLQWALL